MYICMDLSALQYSCVLSFVPAFTNPLANENYVSVNKELCIQLLCSWMALN